MILKEVARAKHGAFNPFQLGEYLEKPKKGAQENSNINVADSRVLDMFAFGMTEEERHCADPDVLSPEAATDALVRSAATNPEVDEAHAYHHFVLSLAPGEHLPHEQWNDVLASVLKEGEYGNCAAYAVMHQGEESGCEHVHLVVCSIDLTTHLQHNAYKYVNKMIHAKDLMVDRLMAEGAAITRENRIDPQILTQGERLKLEAQRKGRDLKVNRARTGRKIIPVIERLSPPVVKKLIVSRTLDEFRQVLNEAGLEMAQKGRGLIFRDKDDHANQCKASAASRSLSAKALERRFGTLGGSQHAQEQSRAQANANERGCGHAQAMSLLERLKAMRPALKAARSMGEFQKILAGAGIEYAARGNGSVFRDKATKEVVKATDADRSFSRKALEKRFALPPDARAAQPGPAPDCGLALGRSRKLPRRIVRLWVITVPQLIRRAEARGDTVRVTPTRITVAGNGGGRPATATVWDCARACGQRFGTDYRVFGTRDFQRRMMKAAAALGHRPHFDDPLVQQEFNEILRNRSIENERKNQLARNLAVARVRELDRERGRAGEEQAPANPLPDMRSMHDDAVMEVEAGDRQAADADHAARAPGGSGAEDHSGSLHDDLAGMVDHAKGLPDLDRKPGRLGSHGAAAMHDLDERRGGSGGRDLSREAVAQEEEATCLPGMDETAQPQQPMPAATAQAQRPELELREPEAQEHVGRNEFTPRRDMRPAAYVRVKTGEQAAALERAGGQLRQGASGRVYRIAFEDLRKAALPGPQPDIFESFSALYAGFAMLPEEAARLYRRTETEGLGRGRGRDDGNSDSMGGMRGGR